MKLKGKRSILFLIGCAILSFVFGGKALGQLPEVLPSSAKGLVDTSSETIATDYIYGQVLKVEPITGNILNNAASSPFGELDQGEQVTVKITSGPWTGKVLSLENIRTGHPAYDIPLSPGARVLLSVETSPGKSPDIHIADRHRAPVLGLLLGLSLLGFLALGKRDALQILGLWLIGGGLLLGTVFSQILLGDSAILWIGGSLVGLIALMLWVRSDIPHKPLVGVGTLGGLVGTTLAMVLGIYLAPLRGFSSETIAAFWQSSPQMDFSGFLVSQGLLINAGLSFFLSSQVALQLKEIPLTRTSILSVGSRLLSSAQTVLVLSSLGLLLPTVFQLVEVPSLKWINLESIASVVLLVIANSIGLTTTLLAMAWGGSLKKAQ